MFRLNRVVCWVFFWSSFALHSLSAHALSTVLIHADEVSHPQGQAKNLSLRLDLNQSNPTLHFSSALKQENSPKEAQLTLHCMASSQPQSGAWDCTQGRFRTARMEVPFQLEIHHLFVGNAPDLEAILRFNHASFSDEAGAHAAEKLGGVVHIAVKQVEQAWHWKTVWDWQTGELFWQPFYMAHGGHQLVAHGKWADDVLWIDAAHLKMQSLGEAHFSAQLHLKNKQLQMLNGDVPDVDLAQAYPVLLKPLLEKTVFKQVDIEGRAALKFAIKNNELQSFDLRLHEVDVADKEQKFSFYKINAHIPWSYDIPKNVAFSYQSGEWLKLPLGGTQVQANINRYALTAPHIKLPVLDGALHLSDVAATHVAGQWYWQLRAQLTPISMADFSSRLQWPRMSGKASAEIPLVTYNAGNLVTEGSVSLNVFNGTATATQLAMQDVLGKTPKLQADIVLHRLDLGDLTRTFSFGAIEGKLDGAITDLELQNWHPVQFDAMVQSSPGSYTKKISQRAVENISALGGAGAAAAIQRSFLRFFEQFHYGKMGLGCKLRAHTCQMTGVESTAQGYVIVKGSGIPAITVMGYNQTVDWDELLSRIKRVTDSNSRAIVK